MRRVLPLLLLLALLLTGCNISGAEELYSLPQRSDEYLKLQDAIEQTLGKDAAYAAPISGENQRAIQEADLDGDGVDEVLVFARGRTGGRLLIHIFGQQDGEFNRLGTIESDGEVFDSVVYAQIDNRDGMELVVSSRLSGQMLQSLSVYSLLERGPEELLHTGCAAYTVTDLNGDRLSDVITLSNSSGSAYGVAAYYRWREDELVRSGEDKLSASAEKIRRVITGNVAEGVPAVFVASTYGESNIVTDVFVAQSNDPFRNVAWTDGEDLSVSTVRSYPVYSTDIDGDGVIELPDTRALTAIPSEPTSYNQSCIIWYNLSADGTHLGKCLTYHNYDEGWYLELEHIWYGNLFVTRREDEALGKFTCLLVSDYVTRHEYLRIYALESSVATEALENESVVLLARRGDTYYCAIAGKDVELDSAALQANFGFISDDTTP